jgi:hypothetical protein
MSGFKDDVISILKQNNMYHREATGLLRGKSGDSDLLETLQKQGFPVTGNYEKFVIRFDYIVLNNFFADMRELLRALEEVNVGGIIVIEIRKDENYKAQYVSMFGSFSVNKVKYEDREYLVIHAGVDYGD